MGTAFPGAFAKPTGEPLRRRQQGARPAQRGATQKRNALRHGGENMSNHLDYEINKELGECYLFMGDLEKAEEYYRKAAGSNGVHPDPYLGLATIAVQRGNLEAALVLYRKAAGIEANDKSLAGMGLVEMETGAHAEAFEHFVAALGMNPGNLVAMNGQIGRASCRERV
jgi:tetratricopeptide (TPR) repeat protein